MSKETKEIEYIEAVVSICGDYAAFHEISLGVVYDLTNDKPGDYGDMTKEEALEAAEGDNDYCDYEIQTVVRIDGVDYFSL